MDWHVTFDIINSGLLALILGGLVQFHKDWSQLSLKVETLWKEREASISAEIDARAIANAQRFAASAGVPHE